MKTHQPSIRPAATPRLLAVLAGISLVASSTLAADVAENWNKHCASCHGKDGKGQTKAGRQSGAKDMTEASYHSSKSDEQMAKAIKEGIKERGQDVMKPYGSKLTDEEIKALVGRVRAFKK